MKPIDFFGGCWFPQTSFLLPSIWVLLRVNSCFTCMSNAPANQNTKSFERERERELEQHKNTSNSSFVRPVVQLKPSQSTGLGIFYLLAQPAPIFHFSLFAAKSALRDRSVRHSLIDIRSSKCDEHGDWSMVVWWLLVLLFPTTSTRTSANTGLFLTLCSLQVNEQQNWIGCCSSTSYLHQEFATFRHDTHVHRYRPNDWRHLPHEQY